MQLDDGRWRRGDGCHTVHMEPPAVVVLGLAGLRLVGRVRRSGRVIRVAGDGRGHRGRGRRLRLARPVSCPSTIVARHVPVEAAGTRFAAVASRFSDPAGLAGFADVGHGPRSFARRFGCRRQRRTGDPGATQQSNRFSDAVGCSSNVDWALSPRDGIREPYVEFRGGRTWGICRAERATFVSSRQVQI